MAEIPVLISLDGSQYILVENQIPDPIKQLTESTNSSLTNDSVSEATNESQTGEVVVESFEETGDVDWKEFMNEITCYRCKFCPFVCGHKGGLISHLRSTHNKDINKDKKSNEAFPVHEVQGLPSGPIRWVDQSTFIIDRSGQTKDMSESQVQQISSSSGIGGRPVKHIYICSECKIMCESIQNLDDHMKSVHRKGKRKVGFEHEREFTKKRIDSTDIRKETQKPADAPATGKRNVRVPLHLSNEYELTGQPTLRNFSKNSDSISITRCSYQGCFEIFKSENIKNYHLQCHRDRNLFHCPENGCLETNFFNSWRSLVYHLWHQHQMDMGMLKCEFCDFRTLQRLKLYSHAKTHDTTHPYMCEKCGQNFKTSKELKTHMGQHKTETHRDYVCQICSCRFNDPHNLTKHVKAVHEMSRPYECSICGYRASLKTSLIVHQRRHKGIRPFSCDRCDYKSTDHNTMRKHKMKHDRKTQYKCPHCDYSSIQSSTLKSHLINKHPGMTGIYICPNCDKYKSINQKLFRIHLSRCSNSPDAPQTVNPEFVITCRHCGTFQTKNQSSYLSHVSICETIPK